MVEKSLNNFFKSLNPSLAKSDDSVKSESLTINNSEINNFYQYQQNNYFFTDKKSGKKCIKYPIPHENDSNQQTEDLINEETENKAITYQISDGKNEDSHQQNEDLESENIYFSTKKQTETKTKLRNQEYEPKEYLGSEIDSNERLQIIKDEYQTLTNEYRRPYFFDGCQTTDAYICVKTPEDLGPSLMDYWHMIWTQKVFTIVLVDDHIRQPYWPTQVNHCIQFDNGYTIQNAGIETQKNYTTTILILSTNIYSGQVKIVLNLYS